jgi:hypothetical protein
MTPAVQAALQQIASQGLLGLVAFLALWFAYKQQQKADRSEQARIADTKRCADEKEALRKENDARIKEKDREIADLQQARLDDATAASETLREFSDRLHHSVDLMARFMDSPRPTTRR